MEPNDRQHPPRVVHPLLRIDGRPARFGSNGRLAVTVAAGPHVVEVMDDHHYESRTVTVDEGGTTELWIGVGLLRIEPRIYLGSREYAAGSIKIDSREQQVAALASIVVFFTLMPTVWHRLVAIEGMPEHVPFLLIVALAVGTFWPARALYHALVTKRRSPPDIGAPAPEPVAPSADPAHQVHLVPRGALLPDAHAAICLRFDAEPGALEKIAIRYRVGKSKWTRPYFSNSAVDWLTAPEVTVNGHPLPARWGTWWIPVRPGSVRLRVSLPGFADGEFGGPSAAAEHEVTVPAGKAVPVDCRYNIVELATARIAHDPGTEAQWQRVLREYGRLERAVLRARAPRLTLRSRPAKSIMSSARLPR